MTAFMAFGGTNIAVLGGLDDYLLASGFRVAHGYIVHELGNDVNGTVDMVNEKEAIARLVGCRLKLCFLV